VRKRSWLRWIVCGLALALLAGAVGWRPALASVGAFLVVDDGLERTDAIVVLSGDGTRRRLDTALALVQRGLADRVIVLTGTPPDFFDEAPAVRRYALHRGVSPDQVVVVGEAHSTLDDALVAAQVMRQRGWTSATVVTAPYHTRRARWVFRRTWGPLGLVVRVHPAPEPGFHPDRWWTEDRSTEFVVLEYVKLAAYALQLRR
jgi:uncharacterized SAM-binding protein YcdF (DUF218 family)